MGAHTSNHAHAKELKDLGPARTSQSLGLFSWDLKLMVLGFGVYLGRTTWDWGLQFRVCGGRYSTTQIGTAGVLAGGEPSF